MGNKQLAEKLRSIARHRDDTMWEEERNILDAAAHALDPPEPEPEPEPLPLPEGAMEFVRAIREEMGSLSLDLSPAASLYNIGQVAMYIHDKCEDRFDSDAFWLWLKNIPAGREAEAVAKILGEKT